MNLQDFCMIPISEILAKRNKRFSETSRAMMRLIPPPPIKLAAVCVDHKCKFAHLGHPSRRTDRTSNRKIPTSNS